MTARILLLTVFAITALIFLTPNVSMAQTGNIWRNTSNGGCNVTGPCTFCDALIVTSNVIQYLWDLSLIIAVAMIVYGALRLMIAGGSENQVKNAKSIILNAVIGLIVALAAWAIINTILHLLAGNLTLPWNQISC